MPPFGLGLGLSTGEAAAALLGSAERLEYTLVGDTVNLSQRLQQLAGAGETVLSEATVKALATPVDVLPLPAQMVKGRDTPVVAFKLSDPGPGPRSCNRRGQNMTGTDLALQMRGVRKTFEAENAPVRALRGVDLDIARGEFVALTGPSGCGKSTLLNLAAGLDVADEGSIFVAGEEVTGQGEDELARMRRRHIGIVFQFFNLLEGVTVLENVALAAIIAGRKRRPAETRARDLLDLLGLGDKASAVPGVLSGGQRQRLAIASALANEPTLVLADEPTGALDSDGGQEVIELLRRLHSGGQTILLVTHDSAVADAAERIVRMLDGRIARRPRPSSQSPPGAASGAGAMTEAPAQTRPRSARRPTDSAACGLPPERAACRGGGIDSPPGRDRRAAARWPRSRWSRSPR